MEAIKVPELRSCCIFIPLREGLLAFTYIRFIYHVIHLIVALFFSGTIVAFYGMEGVHETDHLWFVPLPLLVGLVTYNVLVIAATHLVRDHVKGIQKLIIFGTVLVVTTIPVVIYLSHVQLKYAEHYFSWELTVFILEPLLQGYGLLLLYSLQQKLRSERNDEYVNVEWNQHGGADACES